MQKKIIVVAPPSLERMHQQRALEGLELDLVRTTRELLDVPYVPDVVILVDSALLHENAHSELVLFRKNHPGPRTIFLTASARKARLLRGVCDVVLTKPYQMEELIAAL